MDDDDASQDTACPFCGSDGVCPHLLLVVDKTFRTAEGGVLMDTFNARWSSFFDDADESFDEREAFDEMLDEVDSLSDACVEHDHEGGPGMSSAYATFFVETSDKAESALRRFSEGGA